MTADSDGPLALQRAVERFLHHEAKLLDDAAFAEWLALFAVDGVYWVPIVRGQTDARGVPSIMFEDTAILAMRVQRLLEARALVLTPMPRTTHMVSNIEVTGTDDALVTAEAAFLVVEQQDGRPRLFAGRASYRLRPAGPLFSIVLKRAELMDCDGIHAPITVPF
jgi:benzoate/toluate 1,2-dioxygenase beta subunit